MTVTSQPTATRRSGRMLHTGSAAMLFGGVLLAIGSVLPWVQSPLGSLSGLAGPGLWTLCAGVIAIAGALLPHRRVAMAHAALPGLAAMVLAAWQLARLVQISASTDSWGTLFPGIGLVLAGGGAVILIRAALRIHRAA